MAQAKPNKQSEETKSEEPKPEVVETKPAEAASDNISMTKEELIQAVVAAASAVQPAQPAPANNSLVPPVGYPREIQPGVTELRPGTRHYDLSVPSAAKQAQTDGMRPKDILPAQGPVDLTQFSEEQLMDALAQLTAKDEG